MLNKIKDYFKLQKEIYEYFGYKEDWVVIPLDDRTDDYWFITGEGSYADRCCYAPEPFTKEIIEAGKVYGGWIYTQRFLPKWVYRGEAYTLASIDTKTDGNKFLMIFDNAKECKDEKLIDLYMEKWGSI